jgi:hypothetical protein
MWPATAPTSGRERFGGSFLAYVAWPAKASLFLPRRALRFAVKEVDAPAALKPGGAKWDDGHG